MDRNVLPALTAVSLLFLSILTSSIQNYSALNTPSVNIIWTVDSNPSGGDDIASATCYVDNTILVFGFDSLPGEAQFRVEVRNVKNGNLNNYKVYNPSNDNDAVFDCIVLDGYVYGAGATVVTSPSLASLKAYILKVNSFLDVFEVKDLGWVGFATSVEGDGNYVYIGGGDLKGSSLVFRVDKLDKSLSTVATYKSQGLSGYHLVVASMAFNKVTGHLWIVGVARNEKGEGKWWIEILNPKNMTLVKQLDPKVSGAALSTFSDSNGYMYVLGSNGSMMKLDRNGDIILRKQLESAPDLVKGGMVGDIIVAAGYEKSGSYYRHVIYLLDKDLNVLYKRVLSENVEADSHMTSGRLAIDGSKVYIAGGDTKPGDYRWVIYALEITGLTTTTVAEMVTKEVTRTERETAKIVTTTTIEVIPATPIAVLAIILALTVIVMIIMFRRR